jgi:FkbM family methyltransferase
MVNPRPLRTFLPRLLKKCSPIGFDVYLRSLSLFGHSKATQIGTTPEGNLILRLNSNSKLGAKGFELHIPDDRLFSGQISRYGQWDSLDVEFLVDGLNHDKRSVFCDIGANSGLISLQIKNLCANPSTFVIVEPIPNHVRAIKHNLSGPQLTGHKITICEFALSDSDGKGVIYIQESNRGNSSLHSEVVPSDNVNTASVILKDSKSFASNYLSGFENIVIKSDTQGMDAKILSQFPIEIWQFVSRAVIEIWAVAVIEELEVDLLLKMWSKFRHISWSGETKKLTLDELRAFWLSQSGLHKNLYLAD